MTKLLLVRHGETEWNDSARFQGQTDVPLNDRGRAQAEQVAKRLQRETLAAVYSSDLLRALDTARVIAHNHRLVVTISDQLREASFGSWEGMTFDEVRARFPEEAEGWIRDPVMIRPADGETRDAIVSRVMGALRRIAEAHGDRTVVVVTHGGPIKCAVMCALQASAAAWKKLRIDNATLTTLHARGVVFEVVTVNEAGHLLTRDQVAFAANW